MTAVLMLNFTLLSESGDCIMESWAHALEALSAEEHVQYPVRRKEIIIKC